MSMCQVSPIWLSRALLIKWFESLKATTHFSKTLTTDFCFLPVTFLAGSWLLEYKLPKVQSSDISHNKSLDRYLTF